MVESDAYCWGVEAALRWKQWESSCIVTELWKWEKKGGIEFFPFGLPY
jgi:hypothetical protein